jgi:squalene-associated FAD-dependent desaturase
MSEPEGRALPGLRSERRRKATHQAPLGLANQETLSGPGVLVIGGGLAGISAAIRLREAGVRVTLLESRSWLGGATCSFSRGDLMIDNGQHVFLRCCTAYRDLLARLGVAGSVALQERFDVTVLTPGKQARLRRSSLPAPLHMTGALARYSLLTPAERLLVGRAALGMRFANPASPRLDDQRLGDWLGKRWQGERARRRLWDLFVISSLNVAGDEASAGLSAKVIKTALLESKDAADIGIPTIPLGDLHGKAAARLLDRLGTDVRLGVKAVSVEPSDGGFRVRAVAAGDDADRRLGVNGTNGADATADADAADTAAASDVGGVLTADAVVLAVPSWVAAKLSPAGLAGAPEWAQLGISPIVNVHVRYDRRVTRLPFAAALDSPVQWVFDKTRSAGVPTGQYLAVSLSAADDFVDVPAARLREQFLPALEQLFPAAADASVLDFFVTRERRATFRQVPGSGRLRPGAGTSVPGLALAGAWTDTGWPDTMEGAVRSGQNAAEHIIGGLTARAPGAEVRAERPERVAGGEIAAGASS